MTNAIFIIYSRCGYRQKINEILICELEVEKALQYKSILHKKPIGRKNLQERFIKSFLHKSRHTKNDRVKIDKKNATRKVIKEKIFCLLLRSRVQFNLWWSISDVSTGQSTGQDRAQATAGCEKNIRWTTLISIDELTINGWRDKENMLANW